MSDITDRENNAENAEEKTPKLPWYAFLLFPFWARLKIGKNRTTLVIDEEGEDFVHREATHTPKSDHTMISPNPDKNDPKPMYLKRPRKLPKRMFKPHNKPLDLPEELKKQYEPNNKKEGK